MGFIHKSNKDGGNIGPSIHFLHGQSFRGHYSHGLTLIGISIRPPGEEDTFFEGMFSLYWYRIWIYIRSPACRQRCKKHGDSRWFIGDIINLQKAERKAIQLYKDTDGFGDDLIGRKKFLEGKGHGLNSVLIMTTWQEDIDDR